MATKITYIIKIPPLIANPKLLEKAVKKAVNETTKLVKKDFELTTFGFSERSKAKFTRERAKKEGDSIVGSVWTKDRNYVRLNYGTPGHYVGRKGQLMRFRKGYKKKSLPGVIKSRRGGAFGPKGKHREAAYGPWWVKGIQARFWNIAIVEKHPPAVFRKRLEDAIAALAKS